MLDVIESCSSIAFVQAHTVIHHAEPDRERVTTCTAAKRDGSRKFLWKHGWRFSDEDRVCFFTRCERKFGFDPQLELDKLLLRNDQGGTVSESESLTLPTANGDSVSLHASTLHYLHAHSTELFIDRPPRTTETRQSSGLFGIISSDTARHSATIRSGPPSKHSKVFDSLPLFPSAPNLPFIEHFQTSGWYHC